MKEEIEIDEGSGNVYADLGMADAVEMQVKARLAKRIADQINALGLTQQQAAERLGMPQPKVSNMLRGQFRGISEAKMMDCLNRLGNNVRIVISHPPRMGASTLGMTTVEYA